MKNSKDYAKKIKKLVQTLKPEYSTVKRQTFDDPLDAMIEAVISEHLSLKGCKSTIRKLKGHFVDWNDLRVSRAEEMRDVLGKDSEPIKNIISGLSKTLNACFNKYDTLGLSMLLGMNKRPAKQAIEEIDGMTQFVSDFIMLTALDGHAVPLNERMIEYLKDNDMVHPKSGSADIEGFLLRQIPAANSYEFYMTLREVSEKAKKKTKETAAKAVKKTKKKTKTKEKTGKGS